MIQNSAESQLSSTNLKVLVVCVVALILLLIAQNYKYSSKCSWKHRIERRTNKLDLCPIRPPNLLGQITPNITTEPLEAIEERFKDVLQRGGFYKPKDCKARDRVAIIVTCRGREEEIPILLKNLHPILIRQQLEYQVFIITQGPRFRFNKGALCNAAFIEAMKIRAWDCVIFHDVDTIPMDDRNLYDCPRVNPRHMAVDVDVDKYNSTLLKEDYFGGVFALTINQYRRLNGHSNLFWGWGGEDVDMFTRVKNAGYFVERYPHELTKYQSLNHSGSTYNHGWVEDVQKGQGRFNSDGLNSLKYQVTSTEDKITCTRILVDFVPGEMGMDSSKVEDPRAKKNR